VDYMPVTVTGTFVHEAERHFFATWDGASGFDVYTPLHLDDGRYLLVNRGFVPYELKDAAKRPQGQVAGKVTITGLARNPLFGKPSSMVPDNDPVKNIFYWKDRDVMAATAGLPAGYRLAPIFIDANNAANPGGLPIGGVTLIDLPNNHLQYIFTWYGLAAALVGVMFFWLRRPAKPQ
ncbi:MAG TPA: SURF1 family protein, partial [Mesorhizobium sp.]